MSHVRTFPNEGLAALLQALHLLAGPYGVYSQHISPKDGVAVGPIVGSSVGTAVG